MGKSGTRHGKPKAIVFDAFGTLIAFGSSRVNPYRHFLPAASRHPTERRPFLTRPVGPEVFASELGLEHLLPSVLGDLRTELSGLSLFAEVAEVLDGLRRLQIKTAVCSNLAMPYGEAVRSLLPNVEHFIFSYELGAAKPEPQIYQAACDKLGVAAFNALFIGDSERCDVVGPRDFGMRSAHLDRSTGHTLLDVVRDAMA